MRASIEKILQILGEEVVTNRLLEDQIAAMEASLAEPPPAPEGEPNEPAS